MTQAPVKPVFDKEDQLRVISSYVIQGEILYAVINCKGLMTGFVGLTDRRIIFFDKTGILQKHAMISIPYAQIVAIAVGSDGGLFASTDITVMTAAGRITFEFSGPDKAQWVYQTIVARTLSHTK